ncbi:HEAT repeat-containing protein [Halogranum gelatinilyticum]|uniref:HEAT repeat-containing protein n=1 Tax=Halogranum gelatinilyticum TaxID=660521 RepID=A0A1G9ZPW2_9EURY|nr:HEAT repeat domain-containing protein [Halogranum gelatinilyticum]SDN23145.1 HEAT repeat-containing protein [Halogranum gelatinilyticum]
MTTDSSKPLDGIAPEETTPDDVDDAEIRAALASSSPLVRQRGVEVLGSLAAQDLDAVDPFLDEIATATADDNVAIALRAIGVLDTVAVNDPTRLDGRLDDLVSVLDSELVDVQLTGGRVLATLVVEQPELVSPYVRELVAAIRATELDENPQNFGEVVSDPVTRQTLEQHEQGERDRRLDSRRTLVNVVVAVAETDPDAAVEAVDDLVALLDDVDPTVAGGAVDALGELAASHPDAVAPVVDRLVDCLDHYHTLVRARAIRALGYLGEESTVSALQEVAENDDDEDVRELAADTAEFITEKQ